MFRGLLRPGQGFRKFDVLKRKNAISSGGRPHTGDLQKTGEIIGIITQASQTEKEQWKQNGHPITHKVVQRGTSCRANPTDVLELVPPICCCCDQQNKSRRFLIQGVHDPAELGHFTTYYTEEREDLQ